MSEERPLPELSLAEQVAYRRQHREDVRSLGLPVYPNRFDHTILVSAAVEKWSAVEASALEAMSEETRRIRVPGRIMALRRMGKKAAFLDLSDGRTRLQTYIRTDSVPEGDWKVFETLDLGDHIGVDGVLFRTKTGELSVKAHGLTFLSKSLRPMPDKWHGVTDVEIRYRQRYVDLIVSQETRSAFEIRARLVGFIRRFLDARGFLEVETPMMQIIPGGAAARPFVTYHNTLDLPLYLRIAPELYLKRLITGGFPKVYEINRNFRNEGISTQHNPEFTMLEFYTAYADARDQMLLTEEMFALAATEIHGTTDLPWGENKISLRSPFRRLTMKQAAIEYGQSVPGGPITESDLGSLEALRATARRVGIEGIERFGDVQGKLLAEIFETVAESHLIQPTFIIDYPAEISPLSKTRPDDPAIADRFELFIGGMEIANGFSELNDPEEQAEKFRAQVAQREGGDDEAMLFDEDYIEALSYGMPPAAGEGIGIDRLAMLFTNSLSIRDVILFPLMRPKGASR
jgi:lysyl-tRNA synthetase class 2